MVSVRKVTKRGDVKEFIEFPLRLYKNAPSFVPPLYSDEKKLLLSIIEGKKSDSVLFLAERDGQTVGRIHGLIQRDYNKIHGVKQLRFTRFDSIDDSEVSSSLFSALENWGRKMGMTELCGPLGYSDLDREGLLVEGFDENSTFEEQYNYEYYGALVEKAGLKKDTDWLEFELRMPKKRNEMLHRVATRALEMNGLHVADSNMSKRDYINKYQDGFFSCLDECYKHLYGTVPIAKEAQDELIKQFMMIVNKKFLVIICDKKDKVVAFGLCFPGIGDAVKRSGGRLTLPALIRILKAVQNPKVIDLGLVAVLPEYQNAGLNAVILDSLLTMLEDGEVERCETNLNLETNTAVISQWKHFESRQHKRRRSYIKNIETEKENA